MTTMTSKMFKVGFGSFSPDELINFRLNTWYAQGYLSAEQAAAAGARIHSLADWQRVFQELGQQAEAEQRYFEAAYCYRIAEFITPHTDLGKSWLYDKYQALYYQSTQGLGFEQHSVPYAGTYLPALKIAARGDGPARGTIVIHGGYDSEMEDFHYPYLEFSGRGYDVIAFEGPGQGKAIHKYGLRMIPEWEKPTAAVLDYFRLEDVTLVGVSLGGYLALRAAAYESRVKRVVLWDVIWDFLDALLLSYLPGPAREQIYAQLDSGNRAGIAALQRQWIDNQSNLAATWLFQHGSFVFGVDNLYDYLQTIRQYNTIAISPLVRQDVLCLSGERDTCAMFYEQQLRELVNAKSAEGRMFTVEEQAADHCQVGNLPLLFEYVFGWIERKTAQS